MMLLLLRVMATHAGEAELLFACNSKPVIVDLRFNTVFEDTERLIHELTDAEGDRYVLFAYEVESADFDRSVFDRPDAMSHYPRPWGWSYSSRIIEEDLELKSEGVVTVLAIRAKTSSVWERR